MTKSETERVQFLESLGLSAKGGAALAAPVPQQTPPTHQPESSGVTLAPPGIDPRQIPVDEITFDPRLLDRFPSLEGEGMNAASQYVFSLYKSYTKGDRNKVLHRKISTFITETRLSRKTGGMVTEKVKVTAEERDLAQLIAAAGITADDLAKIIKEKE
jgi:hypothetical protein